MTYLKKALDQKAKDLIEVQVGFAPICDFCADPDPVSVYASTTMSTGERIGCWRWCACEICSRYIDNAFWHLLSSRVQEKLRKMLPEDVSNHDLSRAVNRALLDFHDSAVPI